MGCPLFGSNSGLFTVPGFIVSLAGIKKKEREREEGREKRYKGKERRSKGVEQESRKERNKVLKEKQ